MSACTRVGRPITGPAHTNTTTAAAEVLRKHRLVWYPDGASGCDCEALYSGSHEQHQVDMLTAAGLLADPARTNTTTTAEVLAETLWDMRRHIGLVVADWPTCVETAERHPGSLIARRVAEHRELVVAVHERLAAAGLLADPTTRTAELAKAWDEGQRAGVGDQLLRRGRRSPNPYRIERERGRS